MIKISQVLSHCSFYVVSYCTNEVLRIYPYNLPIREFDSNRVRDKLCTIQEPENKSDRGKNTFLEQNSF